MIYGDANKTEPAGQQASNTEERLPLTKQEIIVKEYEARPLDVTAMAGLAVASA